MILPPLVVGVNVPDATLDKDLVFVHSQQDTQSKRGHLLNQDGVAGAVTLETLKTIKQDWSMANFMNCARGMIGKEKLGGFKGSSINDVTQI